MERSLPFVMRLSIKILGGEECDVIANPEDSVEFLKQEIEAKLKLEKHTEQKLLFKGKALQGIESLPLDEADFNPIRFLQTEPHCHTTNSSTDPS